MLQSVQRFWSKIENAAAAAAAVLIGLAMVLTVAEVICRRMFNTPLPGIIDMFDLGMAAIAFLGASQCQRVGGHVRMELAVRRLSGRTLWFAESVTTGLALVFITAVAVASFNGALFAYENGDSTMDLLLPVWPSKSLITLALGVLTVRLLLQLADSLRLFVDPTGTPIAAPQVASVTDHAREEIEEALGSNTTDDPPSNSGAGR